MRASKAMTDAMKLVKSGMVPRQAAQKVGIALSTMYRSKLYKAWNAERIAARVAARIEAAQQPDKNND